MEIISLTAALGHDAPVTSGALWQAAAGQAGKHPAAARYATDFIVKALRAG